MTTKYQRQWTELEAIKSIYEKEFEELKFPWKVDHPPWFRVNFQLGISIEIRMTKVYPDGVPEIKVNSEGYTGGSGGEAAELCLKLKKEADGLIGSEMCFDLIEIAREFVDSLQKRGKTSFHSEMLQRQEERDRQALDLQAIKQQKVEEALQKQKRAELEELEKKIREELKEKLCVDDVKRDQVISTSTDVFEFENAIQVDEHEIKSVKSKSKMVPCAFGKSFRVKAETAEDLPEFELKIVPLSHPFLQTFGGRRQLELLLKTLKSHSIGRFENVLRCFGGEIDKKTGEMLLLFECPSVGEVALSTVLEQAGCFIFNRVVEYLKQICLGLSWIHATGLTHRSLDLESVFIDSRRCLRVSDYLVRKCLGDLAKEHGITFDDTFTYKEPQWPAPETLSRPNIHGKKVDIWSLGRLTIQMLFGKEALSCWPGGFEELKRSEEWTGLSEEMKEFLEASLAKESEKRMTIDSLLNFKLFSNEKMAKPVVVFKAPVITKMPPVQAPKNQIIATQSTISSSRYLTDFEELEFLGRGGFGSVVKVRNKIDDRFYAVKKIALDPRDVEYNKKILREVTTLSRLHHERIIRYYQAWIEDVDPASVDVDDEEGSESFLTTENAGFYTDKSPLDLSLGPKSFKPFSGLEIDEFSESDSEFDSEFDDFVQFERGDDYQLSQSHTSQSTLSHVTSAQSQQSQQSTQSRQQSQSSHSQVLYIQMEYCPNQTLRDLIDERNSDPTGHFLDETEIWRLFRQIVEGLVHIHAQGMMHRDLKPSNIFLDSNGDVKIGDFGLAVTRIESVGNNLVGRAESPMDLKSLGKRPIAAEKSFTGESHTENIGTPFYVSPEQISLVLDSSVTVRYNQKVDMYSLGIILIELWIPFKTGMERVQCLQRCRLPEIHLPGGLTEAVLEISRRLLCHDAKKRFTSLELLRSDLLPPMLEEELMEDAMRSVAQPGAPHFPRLVSTIFRRLNDLDASQLRAKDFAFDVHSGNATELGPFESISRIKKELERVFLRHGGVEINPPLLYLPLTASGPQSYTVLDDSGQRLELPGNLTRPFARWIAQSSICEDLKRFSVDRVYRKISQVCGGQPFQPVEANFDLVHVEDEGSLLAVCEVIRVLFDALSAGVKCEQLVFKFNHLKLKERIFKNVNCDSLPVNFGGPSILRVPTGVFDEKLFKALNPVKADEPVENLLQRLSGLCPDLKGTILRELTELLGYLQKISVPSKVKVIFDPLMSGPRPDLYENDFCFIVLRENSSGNKKSGGVKRASASGHELIACGGRYNQLVEEYKFPTARLEGKGPFAVGFSIFIDKLVTGYPLNNPNNGFKRFLINLIGENASSDELFLIGEMWRLGRGGDLVIKPSSASGGMNNAMIVIQMKSIGKIVRIKRGREVEECSLDEFGNKIKSLSDEPLSEEDAIINSSNAISAQEGVEGEIVEVHYLLTNSKAERNPILREKAMKALKLVNPTKCELIIHEIPRDILKRFLNFFENKARGVVDEEFRDQLSKLGSLLSSSSSGRMTGKMILLVNHKDNHIELFFNKP